MISRFYLSVPNADGVFMGNKASKNFEEYASLYEFEVLKDSPNKAYFWLASEAVTWALEDIDKRIRPVCESTNFYSKKAHFVRTIEKGVAELLEVSGNWKVVKKAKVEYSEIDSRSIESSTKIEKIEAVVTNLYKSFKVLEARVACLEKMNKAPSSIAVEKPQPKSEPKSHSFILTVHPTYFNNGFFNVSVHEEEYFGADGQSIEICCENSAKPINGKINRSANANKTPRIMGGKELKKWFSKNLKKKGEIKVEIVNKNKIQLNPIPKSK